MNTNQVLITVAAIVLLGALMFLPQWQARRRRQKQMAEIRVGGEVMTVGGLIGKLTYMNVEEDRARIEIAPGVEIRVVMAAISRPVAPTGADKAIAGEE